MLDVTIYFKDGKRGLYDHVSQITNISDNLVLDFITDFGDQLTKVFLADQIDTIKVRCME